MPEARTSMATVTKVLMAAPVVTRVTILRLTILFCGPPPGWLETIALHSMEATALRMPWTVLLAELLELEGSPRDPVRKDWPIRCDKWSRLKRRLSRPFRRTIGNVQLFVNLFFILHARWRFKIVCLQTKLASLAFRKKSNFDRFF